MSLRSYHEMLAFTYLQELVYIYNQINVITIHILNTGTSISFTLLKIWLI